MDIQGEKIKCLSNFHAPELVVGKVYTAGVTRKNVHGVWQVLVEGKWYIHDRFKLKPKISVAEGAVKVWCDTCQGTGEIDETVGGESFSSRDTPCPDCDGKGWWERVVASVDNAPVQQDLVNSPKHYAFFDGVEAIEIIASSMSVEAFRGYCMGNSLKYRLRVGKKDKVEQEIAKADKYGELFEKHKHLCKGDK